MPKRRRRKRARSILTITGVKGTLTWKGNVADLVWSLRADIYGRVLIDFRAVPITDSTSWLLHILSDRGPLVTWHRLTDLRPMDAAYILITFIWEPGRTKSGRGERR